MRQRPGSTETTIDTPARTRAAGALAGALLFLLTALPVHAATGLEPAVEASAQDGRHGQPSAPTMLDTTPRPRAAVKAPRPAASARMKRECRGLNDAIQVGEQAERRSTGAGVIESLRQDLLSLRKRHRQLGC